MSTPLPPRSPGSGADEHGKVTLANESPAIPGPRADVDPLTAFDPARHEDDLRAMTRIVLRPIGSPMPLGFAVAIYLAFALLMEDSRGREVLPIGRLGMARQATHGTLAMQLRDIERQAGVRRTL
jgi:hypothetical protein